MRVSFIQNPASVSSSNTNSIPERSPRSAIPMSPWDRSAGVSATATVHGAPETTTPRRSNPSREPAGKVVATVALEGGAVGASVGAAVHAARTATNNQQPATSRTPRGHPPSVIRGLSICHLSSVICCKPPLRAIRPLVAEQRPRPLVAHVIALVVRGELAGLDVVEEPLHGPSGQRLQLGVAADELGDVLASEAKHVVEHQHLAVDLGPG